jgi:multicomponent Na+:H+ antiporter subunit D
MPPLSGFFAKLALVQAGLGIGQYAIVATALVVGLLTLFSMTKIWAEAFWKALDEADRRQQPATADRRALANMYLPIVLLAALTLTIGLAAAPFFALATDAARQLLDRPQYIEAVLGE